MSTLSHCLFSSRTIKQKYLYDFERVYKIQLLYLWTFRFFYVHVPYHSKLRHMNSHRKIKVELIFVKT